MNSLCEEALAKPRPKSTNVKTIFVSAAALIDSDGKVLITQRPEGKSMSGMWEFPGGKIENGETPEFAVMRELEEELGIETRPCCFSPIGFASHPYDDFHLLMPLFICRFWKNTPIGKEGQDIKWVRPIDLYDYHMPPADLPLIDSLLKNI